jgi:hypothetical protein
MKPKMFTVSITSCELTSESAEHGDYVNQKFVFKNRKCDLSDLINLAEQYSINPNQYNDLTSWWSSDFNVINYQKYRERQYSMHVKINNKRLTPHQFNRINNLLG